MISIITKAKFKEKAKKMDNPEILTGFDETYPYMNQWFVLKDKADFRAESFDLTHCRLTNPEYQKGEVDRFESRLKKTEVKYNRWLEEVKNEGLDS